MDTQAKIQEIVSSHPVVLFMKGNAQFPQCGFSGNAINILRVCVFLHVCSCVCRWDLKRSAPMRLSPPASESAAAASIPVAARLAPDPTSPLSTTTTIRPDRASRQAMDMPMIPAPTTTTSALSGRREPAAATESDSPSAARRRPAMIWLARPEYTSTSQKKAQRSKVSR